MDDAGPRAPSEDLGPAWVVRPGSRWTTPFARRDRRRLVLTADGLSLVPGPRAARRGAGEVLLPRPLAVRRVRRGPVLLAVDLAADGTAWRLELAPGRRHAGHRLVAELRAAGADAPVGG